MQIIENTIRNGQGLALGSQMSLNYLNEQAARQLIDKTLGVMNALVGMGGNWPEVIKEG